MFGCLAVYIGEKIVLILREKSTYPSDNGVWLATTEEHHSSLRSEFPHMRSIGLLGKKITGWQVRLPTRPISRKLHCVPAISCLPAIRESAKCRAAENQFGLIGKQPQNVRQAEAGRIARSPPPLRTSLGIDDH